MARRETAPAGSPVCSEEACLPRAALRCRVENPAVEIPFSCFLVTDPAGKWMARSVRERPGLLVRGTLSTPPFLGMKPPLPLLPDADRVATPVQVAHGTSA